MINTVLKRVGIHAAHSVVAGRVAGSRLNMKLGVALLRDRRVGIWPKLFSLGAGCAAAAVLIAVEIPLESILAFVLPGLGLALDFAADGLEAVVVPILLAGLALPFLAPRELVEQIMAERAAPAVPALPPLPPTTVS